MSTIASPRQSLSLSVRRDSVSTDNTTRSASTYRAPVAATGSIRRNRNALRDYYGLKNAAKEPEAGIVAPVEVEKEHEIDQEGFDAAAYIKNLLANESLEGILRVEASLVSETRNLDGEKKALIYDNYSKLIAATQTIRKMRTNMDPLSPTTSTLTPAISHIAESATELSTMLKDQHGSAGTSGSKAKQRELVQWALATPARMQKLYAKGEAEAAEQEWVRLQTVLQKWEGVKGVEQLRQQCLDARKGSENG